MARKESPHLIPAPKPRAGPKGGKKKAQVQKGAQDSSVEGTARRNSLRKHKYVDYVFATSGYTKDQNNDDGYIPEGETDDVNAGEVDEDGDSKSLCVTDEERKPHSGDEEKGQ
ncbi:Synaptic vesicle glycoprotein 2C [Phytophthora palmivora]|uniref:Synaptic vesicle glycoprotein 2C n=1 Tax=Phytophthora palmivora TaxID=4796 RepID=A0A2P4XMC7_9STRA|nr:Synaptic vesicle glycoprotein 2C [Phytophthora palmivora]